MNIWEKVDNTNDTIILFNDDKEKQIEPNFFYTKNMQKTALLTQCRFSMYNLTKQRESVDISLFVCIPDSHPVRTPKRPLRA